MIKELFSYMREWPRHKQLAHKSFGHLEESIALVAKQKRCQKFWQNHLHNCHEFILENMSHAKHFESLLILGAGPLHELPIEQLAKSFKRIVLVDIVHLRSTQRKFKHLPQLEFVLYDISELESAIVQGMALLEKQPTAFLEEDWGLVISANLLTQIPLHFSQFFEKNKLIQSLGGQRAIDKFLLKVMENHIHYLKAHAQKTSVLLYTDMVIETQWILKKNNLEREMIPSGRKIIKHLPPPIKTWEWEVSPLHEVENNVQIKMHISGFVLKNSLHLK